MNKAESIKIFIAQQWGDRPSARACASILDFVTHQSAQNSEMMTFGVLAKATGLKPTNPILLEAVSILTSACDALVWKFVYFPEDGEPYYLTERESREFVKLNILYDYRTGEAVNQPDEKVVPYFSADKAHLTVEA
jgi:hypothetical protein